MSRSNPYKLKPARPLVTVILIGEGDTEGAFLCHLKTLYDTRRSGVQVKVDWTYGGSPSDIIREAVKLKQGIAYDRAALLLDTDLKWSAEDQRAAEEAGIILVGSKPCIEGMLLKILDPTKQWENNSTKECKKHFHEGCLNADHKLDPAKYTKVFPKAVIEAARTQVKELGALIKLMTEI